MSTLTFAGLGVSLLSSGYKSIRLFGLYRKYYGPVGGTLLQCFGSSVIWKTQLQVLTSEDPEIARHFRKANQQESNMMAIAGTILAQIAITAFTLTDIDRAHWTARGCFAASLVSSIISVYYASKQHTILGRCLNASDIKKWIRGNQRVTPTKNAEAPWNETQVPSVATVLTISAPVALLSVAVYSFLAGLGLYLGFVWKNGLGDSPASDNLAIFITFIVSLSVCHSVYALCTMVAAEQVDDSEIKRLLEKTRHRGVGVRPPIDIQLGSLEQTAESANASEDPVLYTRVHAKDKPTELQRAFREAAQLRRNLAALDDRIAQLLEGLGGSR
ncbi:hypothetical protein BDW62DRAFT_200146 [Aspergillus aurantiobrunneus]